MSEERHTSLDHQGLGLGKPGLPRGGLESPLQPGGPGKSLALRSHAWSDGAEAARNSGLSFVLSQARDGIRDAGDFRKAQTEALSFATVTGKALD